MTPYHIWNKVQNSDWALLFLNHISHPSLPHFVPYTLISLFSSNMTCTLPPQGHSCYQNVRSSDMLTSCPFTSFGSLFEEVHLRRIFPDHLNWNGSPTPTSTLHHFLSFRSPCFLLIELITICHHIIDVFVYLLIVCCPPVSCKVHEDKESLFCSQLYIQYLEQCLAYP